MRRRAFIAGLGAAVAWPFAARGQQPIPVIGVLSTGSLLDEKLAELREGLREFGYEQGRNFGFEFRYGEDRYDRLPALAADLVGRRVAVILASGGGGVAPLAAKAATTTIPIVFTTGADPIQSGIVSSLNRPGGNITGVSFANNISESKQMGLLHVMIPEATNIGALVNPDNASVETELRDLKGEASALGVKLEIARARREEDFEPAFADLERRSVGASSSRPTFFSAIESRNWLRLRHATGFRRSTGPSTKCATPPRPEG